MLVKQASATEADRIHALVDCSKVQGLCLKSRTSALDTVSTGSGSDLVSDQHAMFLIDFDSHR